MLHARLLLADTTTDLPQPVKPDIGHADPPMNCTIDTPTRPRVSVVVAVRGNTAALPGLIAALASQDVAAGEVELVVVDNHARPQVPGVFVENTPRGALGSSTNRARG